jgi:hypothetical protein
MAATIPQQLQAKRPTKPLTQAQLKQLRQPTSIKRELTSEEKKELEEYQQQLQEYNEAIKKQEENISKVDKQLDYWKDYLKTREKERQDILKIGRERDIDVSDQIRNSQEREEMAKSQIRELERRRTQIKQGYDVGADVSRAVELSEREMIASEKESELRRQLSIAKQIGKIETKIGAKEYVLKKGKWYEIIRAAQVPKTKDIYVRRYGFEEPVRYDGRVTVGAGSEAALKAWDKVIDIKKKQALAPPPKPDVTSWTKQFLTSVKKHYIEEPSAFAMYRIMKEVPSPQEAIKQKYPGFIKGLETADVPLFVLPGKKDLRITTPIGMIADIKRGKEILDRRAIEKRYEEYKKSIRGEEPEEYKTGFQIILEGVKRDVKEGVTWLPSKVSEKIIEKVPYETRKKYLADPTMSLISTLKPSPTKEIVFISETESKRELLEATGYKPGVFEEQGIIPYAYEQVKITPKKSGIKEFARAFSIGFERGYPTRALGTRSEVPNIISGVIGIARPISERKAKQKEELIDRYERGEKLTFSERDKISSYIRERKKSQSIQEEYQQNKIKVIDLKTGKYRFEKMSEYLRRTAQSTSIVQKYYSLFGAEFYAKGEREAIAKETEVELKSKYNEKYQAVFEKEYKQDILDGKISFEDAANKFINNNKAKEIEAEFQKKIDTSAPTVIWQNVLISLTDFYMKSKIFSPYMKTGAAKKQELTERQKLEVYKKAMSEKEASEKAQEVVRKLEDTYKTNGKIGVEKKIKELFKSIKNKEAKSNFERIVLRDLNNKGIIRNYIFNENTGDVSFVSELGRTITRPTPKPGVLSSEIFNIPKATKLTPRTIDIQIEATDLFAPQLEKVAEVSTSVFLLSKLFGKEKQKEKTNLGLIPLSKLDTTQKEETDQVDISISKLGSSQLLDTTPSTKQITGIIEIPKINEKPKLDQPSIYGFSEFPQKSKFIPEKPTFKIPFGFIDLSKKPKYKKGEQVGYHTHVKEKGKYVKVTNKPHTKSGAIDVGARYTDNTLSATFKIEPIKRTKVIKGKKVKVMKVFKEKDLKKGDNYFTRNINKFRDYQVRKGREYKLDNKWIERQRHRADTPGEQRGLSVAKYRAEIAKNIRGIPTRKSKRRSRVRSPISFFGMR